jgi:hypothetical protein
MTPAWLSEESSYALRVPESDPGYCLLPPLRAQAPVVVLVDNSLDGKERRSKGDIRFRNHCEPARECHDMKEEQNATRERRASTSRPHHIAPDMAADSWPRVRPNRERLSGVPHPVILPAHSKMQHGPGLGYCRVQQGISAAPVIAVAAMCFTDYRAHGWPEGLVGPGAASAIAHGLLHRIVEDAVQFQGQVADLLRYHGSIPRAWTTDDRRFSGARWAGLLEALSGWRRIKE